MIRLRNKSSSGGVGGLMRGIKIPLQDFALKKPGRVGGGAYLRDYGICDFDNVPTTVVMQKNIGMRYFIAFFETTIRRL